MSGPRLTAPAAKLARSISTSASTSVPQSGTLITSSKYAAPLSRKYADLLEERNLDTDSQHPRHMYTRSSNRPHPPPQRIRLMQTFTSSSARPAQSDKSTIDFATLPSYESLQAKEVDPVTQVRMPLLPDNYLNSHAPEEAVAPLPEPVISVIASHPENVIPAALTEVEGMGVDGVELSFAHEEMPRAAEEGQGMLRDIWRGLMDDVFGGEKSKTAV